MKIFETRPVEEVNLSPYLENAVEELLEAGYKVLYRTPKPLHRAISSVYVMKEWQGGMAIVSVPIVKLFPVRVSTPLLRATREWGSEVIAGESDEEPLLDRVEEAIRPVVQVKYTDEYDGTDVNNSGVLFFADKMELITEIVKE